MSGSAIDFEAMRKQMRAAAAAKRAAQKAAAAAEGAAPPPIAEAVAQLALEPEPEPEQLAPKAMGADPLRAAFATLSIVGRWGAPHTAPPCGEEGAALKAWVEGAWRAVLLEQPADPMAAMAAKCREKSAANKKQKAGGAAAIPVAAAAEAEVDGREASMGELLRAAEAALVMDRSSALAQFGTCDVGLRAGLPRGGVSYVPNFITAQEEQALLDILYCKSALPRWLGRGGKHGRRTQNWGGRPGALAVAEPLPPFCRALIDSLVSCGIYEPELAYANNTHHELDLQGCF